MAQPGSNKSPLRSSPWIDEDGDILVSLASTTSSEFDPEFDSTEQSEPGEKSPRVHPKNPPSPSASGTWPDTEKAHTTPTLRADRRKQKILNYPGSTSSPPPLQSRSIPFPVDTALRNALHEGEPVLAAIFGKATVRALVELERRLPCDLLVSDGEYCIREAVWTAAAKGLSDTENATLKAAAKRVKDRDQWDRILREGKQTLDAGNYPATVLGNADISCKMVFRLLQML